MTQIPNPYDPALYQLFYQQANKTFQSFFALPSFNPNFFGVGHIFEYWFQEIQGEPNKILAAQLHFFKDFITLGQELQQNGAMINPKQLGKARIQDKRFEGSQWQEEPLFNFIAQAYLLFVQHCMQFIAQNPSTNPKINKQVAFFTRQYLDALSPSNYILTNPEIIKQCLTTQGENLINGMNSFIRDIQSGNGYLNIQMTDGSAFEIGKNIAITPGKVVFQNPLFQLIQYTATTPQIYEIPLLIIPPCINKYYILDLSSKNSLVKWLVDQGITVFMISWVNPDQRYQDTTFEDYYLQVLSPQLILLK